jgi:phosphatidylglycerol:prolipoprotein diacylglycerol transferase
VQRIGQDPALVPGMVFWMLLGGFGGAFAFKLLYAPNPWDLLRGGIASFGGLFVGLAAACLYLRKGARKWGAVLHYMDALAFVFPRAWLFGRLGCALAHDHPGLRTESWLGVRFPDGARYDLGLLEVFFILGYLGLLAVLDRRQRPSGFYLGLFLSTYGLFRLFLDRLHEAPVRYGGWSVDQYASVAALVLGVAILYWMGRKGPTREE